MSYRSKVRIGIIILIIMAISFFNGMADIQKADTAVYENEIAVLKRKLERANLTIKADTLEYSNNLKDIVRQLYSDEVYGIGGDGVQVHGTIDELYDAIINYSTDFKDTLNNVHNYFNARKVFKKDIPDIFPVRYDKSVRITSGFGMRYSPISGKIIFHKGIDIVASGLPCPIIATADGVVTDVWIYHPIYGKMVMIRHKYSIITMYAHMRRTTVREKQHVKKGQIIGYMGATGKAHGRHVHYEIHKNGKVENPLDYLKGIE